jgi:proton glutamate symport protein
MKKPALHWQIIIALLFGTVYGILFSTQYKLNEKSFSKLEYRIDDKELTQALKKIENKTFSNKADFKNSLIVECQISEEIITKYFGTISNLAYYNPPVKAISWMGDIFLRGLKMLVIPLIICSIVTGIINLGQDSSLGRLGLKTIAYYLSTSTFAILTGLLAVGIFRPGKGFEFAGTLSLENLKLQQKSLWDILIEIVPENIFQSLAENHLLSVIFLSVIVGVFITRLNEKQGKILIDFFNASFELFMKITMFIILLAPLGIFGLIAKVAADQENFLNLALELGKFSLAAMSAILFHAFITMPLMVKFIGRSKPFRHFQNMSTALLTAFSTTSSAATLPLTIKNVQEKSGVSGKISNFTLPMGATVNMDGTAIYICVVVMFIAQVYGLEMGFKQQLFVLITALLTSIGTAAIPMASLVIITLILTALGLPVEGIALILPVDRILDMFRTATNVWSDSCGAVIIARSEGEKLKI